MTLSQGQTAAYDRPRNARHGGSRAGSTCHLHRTRSSCRQGGPAGGELAAPRPEAVGRRIGLRESRRRTAVINLSGKEGTTTRAGHRQPQRSCGQRLRPTQVPGLASTNQARSCDVIPLGLVR